MKISTFYLSLLISLVLALSVSAVPGAKPSSTPKKPSPPPPISKCKKEPFCCVKETHTSDKEVTHLTGLLHAKFTEKEKTQGVGLTCSKLKIKGVKKLECKHKPLCCDKFFSAQFSSSTLRLMLMINISTGNGILAVGCTKSTLS